MSSTTESHADVSPAEWRDRTVDLADALVSNCGALVRAQRQHVDDQLEIATLRRRVDELQTWVERSARFDSVEHVQLGRLLALEAAERERRSLPIALTIKVLAYLAYAAAAVAVAWLVLTRRI